MHDGSLPRWWGSGGLASTDGLVRLGLPFVGLGMWNFGSDGPVMACSVWGCVHGPEKHCSLWDCGDGPVKHCCLWRFALCWARGRFKCIGCMCSLVLSYFLPCALMM